MEIKGKVHTVKVFISSQFSATDMASHHLTHRLIVQTALRVDIMQAHLLSVSREITY